MNKKLIMALFVLVLTSNQASSDSKVGQQGGKGGQPATYDTPDQSSIGGSKYNTGYGDGSVNWGNPNYQSSATGQGQAENLSPSAGAIDNTYNDITKINNKISDDN